MDNRIDTLTNNVTYNLSKEMSVIESSGFIKPTIARKELFLIGTWACALMITSPINSVNHYDISTTLSYPNKNTQATISYEPSINESNLLENEINNNIFVKTKPERSYAVKLNIKSYGIGKPIIDNDTSYES